MDIYLANSIIGNLDYSNTEIAVYTALKSLYVSNRDTQVISYNMIAHELFASKKYTRTAFESVKNAFDSLVNNGLVIVKYTLSKTEFVLDMKNLYFNYQDDGTFYTVINDDEMHRIMNIDNRMDKFALFRYFIICISTINKNLGVYGEGYDEIINNFVGNMSQEFLAQKIGENYKKNNKLICNYNDVLEQNHLLYIYRHEEFIRNKNTGEFRSFKNHYGRYENKDNIIKFALQYEKSCGVNEEIVKNDKANNKRRLAQRYNNLYYDFDRYVEQYSETELIEIYTYIHHENSLLIKEIEETDSFTWKDRCRDKLRDEDIFNGIPSVVNYIGRKNYSQKGNWDEQDIPLSYYPIEAIAYMQEIEETYKQNDDLYTQMMSGMSKEYGNLY